MLSYNQKMHPYYAIFKLILYTFTITYTNILTLWKMTGVSLSIEPSSKLKVNPLEFIVRQTNSGEFTITF